MPRTKKKRKQQLTKPLMNEVTVESPDDVSHWRHKHPSFSLTSYIRGLEIAAHFDEWERVIQTRKAAHLTIEKCSSILPGLERDAQEARSLADSFPNSERCDNAAFDAVFARDGAKQSIEEGLVLLKTTRLVLLRLATEMIQDWTDVVASELEHSFILPLRQLVVGYIYEPVFE